MNPHTLVRASAGSGKTYQLTNRFIARLIDGEDPSGILATTFTKAAAGEILHRVLLRLSNAVLEEKSLHDLKTAIDQPTLDTQQCVQVLEQLCRSLHRLSILTMDAFFFRLASSFAHELGLPPQFGMLDDEDHVALQESSVDQTIDQCTIPELVEILRSLHGDKIQMMAHDSIMQRVNNAYSIYLAAEARPEPWRAIGHVGMALNEDELSDALDQVEQLALPSKKDGKPDSRWVNARNDLRSFVDSQSWEPLLDKGLGKLVLQWQNSGELGSYYSKECTLELAESILPIVDHARYAMWAQHAARGAATYALMKRFDEAFRSAKMSSGQLSFDDPPRLLSESAITGNLEHIYYRLDTWIRHVLLDEFQDTSMPQFKLFEPILDELLSQDEEDRSVFVVGDIKQSLYTWRQSEPTLLNELPNRWPTLHEETLAKSWRSSPFILNAVNDVFGDLLANQAISSSTTAVQVAESWDSQYKTHQAARTELPGHVTLSVADGNEESSDQANEEVLWACANRVAEIQKHQPNASIAVLVRQTKHIYPLLSMLSKLDVEACEDRGNPLVNAPCVASAVSLLELIEHPGNTAALFHVQSTPLGEYLGLDKNKNINSFASSMRQRISTHGCASLLIELYKAIAHRTDKRGSDRFLQLIDLAGQLEDEGKSDIETMIHRANTKKIEEPGRSQVRVITIHRSKGLEFDAVVIPLLGQAWKVRPESILATRDDSMGPITRITPYPKKILQSIHPDLKAMHDECFAKQVNEELCCLYVAMTRAKSALHMIVPADKDGRKGNPTKQYSISPSHVIRSAFAPDAVCSPGDVLYESGSETSWSSENESRDSKSTPVASFELRLCASTTPATSQLPTSSPSSHAQNTTNILNATPTESDSDRGMSFGTCVHYLFEQLDWIDNGTPDFSHAQLQLRTQGFDDDLVMRASECVFATLGNPDIQSLFSHQVQTDSTNGIDQLTVHHERPFALRLQSANEDRLIQGRFDRLVIGWKDHKAAFAQIVDYKTDADAQELDDDSLINRHGPQIAIYRQAITKMYGINPSNIDCILLMTARPGIIKL
jgi:ATP-dependent helicase/nuclease subunit A